MKTNPVRYSSAVGEIIVMATFKIKYCHKLFDNQGIRELTDALFHEAFDRYKISCQKISFDSKKLRGYVGYHLFKYMPWLKKNKWEGGYFWNSGFWNPAYDIRNVRDLAFYHRYLDKQKYSSTHQKMITCF